MSKAWSVAPFLVIASLGGVAAEDAKPVQTIDEGVLDSIELYTETAPSGVPVVIRPFPADRADLGTGAEGGKEKRVAAAKHIQEVGPGILAKSFVEELKDQGGFSDVRVDDGSPIPDGAIVVEGSFTQLDPGSKAKRYWVGFGAGKSGTEVEGTVKDASGNVLAKFRQKRIAAIGVFGGDYVKKMTSDCESIGEDIAEFLSTWAKGKPLKEK